MHNIVIYPALLLFFFIFAIFSRMIKILCAMGMMAMLYQTTTHIFIMQLSKAITSRRCPPIVLEP